MNISKNEILGAVEFPKGCKAKGLIYGNVWIFPVNLPNAGDSKGKHKHEFDHIHYTVKGKGKLIIYESLKNNEILAEKILIEDEYFKVPKEHIHEIIALDGGYFGHCIHAVRDNEGKAMKTDYLKDMKG